MTATNDHRILELAKEIKNASDIHVPVILLRVREYIGSAKPGSGESSKLIADLWKLGLVPMMVVVLKEDFARIRQNWETASGLARLVVDVFKTLDSLPLEDKASLRPTLVPEAGENLLILIRRIQDRYVCCLEEGGEQVTETTGDALLDRYDEVLKSAARLCTCFPEAIALMLKSPWFLQIFITDDEATGMGTMNFLLEALKIRSNIFTEVPSRLLQSILDEMIYNLSTSDSVPLAGLTLKLLLTICRCYPTCVTLLCTKYHGLKLLLTRWIGKGNFGRELSQMVQFLDGGTLQQVEMDRENRGVILIQSVWRSFLSRARMRRMNHGIAKLQVAFKERREVMERNKQDQREQKDLKHQIALARQRRVRHRHEEELELMDSLPAPIVARHVASEHRAAATQIQASWRGRKERLQLGTRREVVKEARAAIVIQRQVRLWLARLENRRFQSQMMGRGIAALTETRREELTRVHEDWCAGRSAKPRSQEDQEQLYRSAQMHLHKHLYERRKMRRQDQERLANLARLETDATMLSEAPTLETLSLGTSLDSINRYATPSLPIARQAARMHAERLRRIESPWWRQLIPAAGAGRGLDDDEDPELARIILEEAGHSHRHAKEQSEFDSLQATCCQ